MKQLFLILCIALYSIPLFAQNYYEHYDMEGNRYNRWHPEVVNVKYYDQQVLWREYPGAKLNLYLNPLGTVAGVDWGGPSIDVAAGVRFNKYLYLGAESGFNSSIKQIQYGESNNFRHEAFVPMALNTKGLLPVGKRCCLFVEGSFGGYFGVMDLHSNGLYLKSGFGFEFNRLVVSLGYTGIPCDGFFRNLWYVRFGFRIGR